MIKFKKGYIIKYNVYVKKNCKKREKKDYKKN